MRARGRYDQQPEARSLDASISQQEASYITICKDCNVIAPRVCTIPYYANIHKYLSIVYFAGLPSVFPRSSEPEYHFGAPLYIDSVLLEPCTIQIGREI